MPRVPSLLAALVAPAVLAAHGSAAHAQETCTPSRLMFVLDKSSSMQTGTIGGQTKWSIAVDALDDVATQFESSIELGLMMFPQPNECSPGSLYVTPGLGTRDAMMSELAAPPPSAGNWTPMAQTLEAAALEPSLQPGETPRYAVLITDGWQWCSPYDPATRFAPVDAVGDLNAIGVTTYVVGFGDAVDALTLNQVAVTAGTARAGCNPSGDTPTAANPCYYQADDPAELVDALEEIAAEVAGDEVCDGLDNDCDGLVDEDLVQTCGTACGTGTETCEAGDWVGCDAPEPAAEVCDGLDNDCDGTADPGCDCVPGETRSCGGPEACEPGVQTCADDGTWGACDGAVQPGAEMCDGLDNDCDGRVDESELGNVDDDVAMDLCGPGFVCDDGVCDPVPPQEPHADDEQPAAAGDTVAGCGCRAGASGEGGLGALLLAAATAFTLRRRRR